MRTLSPDHTTTPPGKIPLSAPPVTRVARSFTLARLTRSETAERWSIANRFESREQLEAAVHLCRNVMQPVRDHFGSLEVNSVYRSQALERALKNEPESWTSRSQHTRGEACDIEVPGTATLDLARWIEGHLAFDQLICECYDPREGPNTGWVHISLRPPGGTNRHERLSYVKDIHTERYVYVSGLVESIG